MLNYLPEYLREKDNCIHMHSHLYWNVHTVMPKSISLRNWLRREDIRGLPPPEQNQEKCRHVILCNSNCSSTQNGYVYATSQAKDEQSGAILKSAWQKLIEQRRTGASQISA
jgi:hypothetical protein